MDPSDDGAAEPASHARDPLALARTVAVAAVLGVVGALVTVGFIRAMEEVKDLLFTDLPDALDIDPDARWYILVVVVAGGALLGVARKALGEYPVSLEQAIEDHKATGQFDYRHVWQAIVISLISLGFGAALGPEAALMAIVGGLSTWIGLVIEIDSRDRSEVGLIGVSGALGALFGVGGAALTVDPRGDDVDDVRSGRILRLLPALAAAVAGLYVYRALETGDSYFDLGLPTYTFAASDLAWALPLTAVGIVVGLAFVAVGALADRLLSGLEGRPVVQSMTGGLVLGVLAVGSTLVLFSGHEGIRTMLADLGEQSSGELALLSLAKIAAASALLATGWKGGRFFPLMFAGAAAGLACSEAVSAIGTDVALAVGMTAPVAVLLRRPVLAVLFMVWFFPTTLWPAVVIAAVLGALIGRRVMDRLAPPEDDEAPVSR